MSKIGSPPPPQGHGWQSPARVISASSSGKEALPKGRQPRIAKARPPISGGRAGLLRPHLIGKTQEDRIRSPDREELQVVSKIVYVGKASNHGSSASGLAAGGQHSMLSAHPSFNRNLSALNTVMPNHSLNRTFCGTPALGFISFSPKAGVPQNAG